MAEAPLKDLIRTRIRATRLARGFTQEALSERADISVDAINRIENGGRVPTIETLEKIARALGISAADLLIHAPPKPVRIPAPLRRMVVLLEKQPAVILEGVEDIVRITLKLAVPTKRKRKS